MKIIKFVTPADIADALPAVVAHLREGKLIAYPTETVYGFGSLVREDALDALAALKSRDVAKPFLLLVREAADVPQLQWTESARKLAKAFWPGALTLALAVEGDFAPRIISESGTLAVRATPHEGIRALLESLREPLTSTSVNTPGDVPASSGREAARVVDVLGGEDILILDGGELAPSAPSTLLDCSAEPPRLLRAGAITVETLTQVAEITHG